MTTPDEQAASLGSEPADNQLLGLLPNGSELQRIAFVVAAGEGQRVLMEFDAPRRRRAVLTTGALAGSAATPDSSSTFEVLTIPATGPDELEPLEGGRAWVDSTSAAGAVPSLTLSLHGAQIVWRAGRAAVVAPVDRLDAIRRTLIEFAFFESELRDIEREVGEGWPQLQADSPLAFDFDERSVERRHDLAKRFQQALDLRGRIARLMPLIHHPHVHPPTLASQVSERLRERTRLADRVEFSSGQIEIFERVYELCGHRASEFQLSHKGHNLEWIIIVLLAVQTILLLVERMATLGN